VYTPETSYVKVTSVHIKNTCIKQPCSHKVGDFVTAFRVRKLFGTFEKQAPELIINFLFRVLLHLLWIREQEISMFCVILVRYAHNVDFSFCLLRER